MKINEIITANEALRRVGCAELCHENYSRVFINWTGQPIAFGCGHTRVESGYPIRVSQHLCSGHVLYSWQCVSSPEATGRFLLNSGFCVSIDNTGHPSGGRGDTFLAAHIYG
jgi:hypothetical protein